jgi:L-serine dehydratase
MKSKHIPGIFNDVIGPIMRGPSSSHTAAAHRIGSMIRQAAEPGFTKVIVEFDKSSALATTYLGQGSALGLAGGLIGLEMTNPEIINYKKHLENSSFTIEYIITDIENKHPNAYQISIQYPGKDNLDILAISTGGGMIEIVEWNGFKVSLKGDFFETLLFSKTLDAKTITEMEHLLKTLLSNIKIYRSEDTHKGLMINIKTGKSLTKELENIPGLNSRT